MITEPIALDKSLNTTDQNPKNLADVVQKGLNDIKNAIGGGGGGGGHTIVDSDGQDMPQEDAMQFADAFVSDDDVNGRTVVENVKEVASADYSSETEDGMYLIPDGEGAVIGPASDDKVEVTASGDTYRTFLNKVYAEIDHTKINDRSYIEFDNLIFRFISFNSGNNSYIFTSNFAGTGNTAGGAEFSIYLLANTSAYGVTALNTSGTTNSNKTTDSIANGTKITLYYGNKKATVDLQTTANRCWYDSSKTVKQKIDGLDVGKVNQVYEDWAYSLSFKARGGNGHALLFDWQAVMAVLYNDSGVISILDIIGSGASHFSSSISDGVITITRDAPHTLTLFY